MNDQVRDYKGRFSYRKCTNTHDLCHLFGDCTWCEVTNKKLETENIQNMKGCVYG